MNRAPVMVCVFVAAIGMYHEGSEARRPDSESASFQLAPETLNDASPSPVDATAAYTPYTPYFCATRTVIGTYQYREEGYWEGEPYRSSGLETFDGRGNIVGMATDSDTGENYRFTGTYEIDGDCHGRVSYAGGDSYDIYVAPDGSTIEFISTDPFAVLSGPSRRVSIGRIVQ